MDVLSPDRPMQVPFAYKHGVPCTAAKCERSVAEADRDGRYKIHLFIKNGAAFQRRRFDSKAKSRRAIPKCTYAGAASGIASRHRPRL